MTIEGRVREIISPSIDEWIGQKIDTAELERRKELARQQAVAEDTLADSGNGTAAAALPKHSRGWAIIKKPSDSSSHLAAHHVATLPASSKVRKGWHPACGR